MESRSAPLFRRKHFQLKRGRPRTPMSGARTISSIRQVASHRRGPSPRPRHGESFLILTHHDQPRRVATTRGGEQRVLSVDNLGITPWVIHNLWLDPALASIRALRFRPLLARSIAITQLSYPQALSFLWIIFGALLARGFHVPTFGRKVATSARTQAHSNPGYPHTRRLFARSTAFMKFVRRVPPG